MWPDRVSNPGPLIYESDALPTALRGPASAKAQGIMYICTVYSYVYNYVVKRAAACSSVV